MISYHIDHRINSSHLFVKTVNIAVVIVTVVIIIIVIAAAVIGAVLYIFVASITDMFLMYAANNVEEHSE